MKAVCLFFELHQPLRLKRYRFFDIGNDHYYYDDYTNETILKEVSEKCYLPTNKLLLRLIRKHGNDFRLSFSLTGVLIDQLETYVPEVLDSFRELAATGQVEFLAETYSHSLACIGNRDEFTRQVNRHREKIEHHFGLKPVSFRNTEMVYSDEIGSWVADMGFKAMLTEGARHILGWRSPDFLYCNNIKPKLKVLLRNFSLSDDIAFRFGNRDWNEWPLTADKYAAWINKRGDDAELINLFIDYETFGEHQKAETGIFKFLEALPATVLKKTGYSFMTPAMAAKEFQPVSALKVQNPLSWADEERDLTAWLGNELQDAAFNKLYSLTDRVNSCNDEGLLSDWKYLQVSDHFYYMCTKFFSDGEVHKYFNPYESPYDAFMNYMNVLSDFELRLDGVCAEGNGNREIINLMKKTEQQEEELARCMTEIRKLRSKIKSMTVSSTSKPEPATGAKPPAKKDPATKPKPPAKKEPATKPKPPPKKHPATGAKPPAKPAAKQKKGAGKGKTKTSRSKKK